MSKYIYIGLIIILIIVFMNRKTLDTALGGLPRGYMNRNPGNIDRDTINGVILDFNDPRYKPWQNEIKGTDKRFRTFKTMIDGYRAIFVNLRGYARAGYNTINKIIDEWAPPKENDTVSYKNFVSKRTGISLNTPVSLSDKKTMIEIAAAISRIENGIEPNYSDIENGYNKL